MSRMKTRKEIVDVMERAYDQFEDKGTVYPGMAYEEGVIAALEWVLRNTEEDPMDERGE